VQNPPNNGVLNSVGSSGIMVNLADPSTDLDIYYDQATATNTTYLVANVGTSTSDNLYTVNLTTGGTTLVGKIGLGIAITDVAAFLTVPAVETACDDKAAGCIRFEMISVRRDAKGDETYRIRITNTCASPVNYAAFTLPNGVEAIGMMSGSNYLAPSTRSYTVRNPNFSPFYSIRFKTNGTGIANGQSDIFEYKLPKQAHQVYINAYVKLADGSSNEAYLNTFSCPTQNFDGTSDEEKFSTDDRSSALVLATGDMKVFPNPTAGQVFVDLSAWTDQEVRLSVLGATGQRVQQMMITGGSEATLVNLPEVMANGLYYLEMQAADGTRQVRRFVVQR